MYLWDRIYNLLYTVLKNEGSGLFHQQVTNSQTREQMTLLSKKTKKTNGERKTETALRVCLTPAHTVLHM